MSPIQEPSPEMLALAAAACEGTADADELRRLEAAVAGDEAAIRLLLDHFRLQADLTLRFRGAKALSSSLQDIEVMLGRNDGGSLDIANVAGDTDGPSPSAIVPLVGSPMHDGWGYLSSGWPVAYLVATVILGVGLLLGASVYVSTPVQVVKQLSPLPSHLSPLPPFVGRITGMVDCQWTDPTTAVPGPVAVPLGRKYALASGLMEITYNGGAKVILQGPCTYEVESPAGGFLSVGKLTAKVEKRGERREERGEGEEIDREGSQSTPYSVLRTSYSALFSVRTPTAIVTDLGTEFAVDVDPEGPVEVHVFQGVVETSRQGSDDTASVKERLSAGEAIRFESAAAIPKRIPVESSPLTTDALHAIPKARSASLLDPVGIVATTYHRVWQVGGKPGAENDRLQAFRVATDGVFGRGENGQGPRSSFDTLDATLSKPTFVGLLYDRRMRFDRIKVFLGPQFNDGGHWRQLRQVFILKRPIDPGSAPPENDPVNWRAVPLYLSYGPSANLKAGDNPGEVLEFVLTIPEEDRTGYGWAVGSVKDDDKAGYVSITELRAYGAEVAHDQ